MARNLKHSIAIKVGFHIGILKVPMSRQPLVIVAVLVTAFACRGTEPNPDVGPDPAIGTYDLKSIDGQPVPVQMTDRRVVSGSLSMNEDHTFQRGYWQTNAQGGQGGLIASEGTWIRLRGDSIELTNTLQVTFAFSVAARGDTIMSSGWAWVRQP
jgi:hypothetical protein